MSGFSRVERSAEEDDGIGDSTGTAGAVHLVAWTVGVCLWAGTVLAQPGTLIQNVNLPVSGTGVSVAVDCLGNVYYTLASDTNLYKMDKNGVLLSTTPITDSVSHAGLFMDEFAWDETRKVLWSQEHNTQINIYQLDPVTGIATFQFTRSSSIGTFRDGIAFDGTDDSVWICGDVCTTIDHFKASDGSSLGSVTPLNSGGGALGSISGVIVGVGDQFYLGQNGRVQIVRAKKSDGTFIDVFTSPGGARDEGLECDPVNFAPKLALWSREFNNPGFMSVIELEPGTCACGGSFDPFGGVVRTNTRRVRLTVFRMDPTDESVRCAENSNFDDLPFTPFTDGTVQVTVELSAGDGAKSVCCEYKDDAGAVSPPQCGVVVLEQGVTPGAAAPAMSWAMLGLTMLLMVELARRRLRSHA